MKMDVVGPQFAAKKCLSQQTVFHEDWWLNAVTKGNYQEVLVKTGTDVVGRLPFVTRTQMASPSFVCRQLLTSWGQS